MRASSASPSPKVRLFLRERSLFVDSVNTIYINLDERCCTTSKCDTFAGRVLSHSSAIYATCSKNTNNRTHISCIFTITHENKRILRHVYDKNRWRSRCIIRSQESDEKFIRSNGAEIRPLATMEITLILISANRYQERLCPPG